MSDPVDDDARNAVTADQAQNKNGFLSKVDGIFVAAILVGLLFTFSGVALPIFGVSEIVSRLILASGLGIIMGAFGSTATLKYKGVVIAGCAAITLVFGAFLHFQSENSYAELHIIGLKEGTRVRLIGGGGHEIYGAEINRGRRYKFLASLESLGRDDSILSANIDIPNENPILFDCIQQGKHIKNNLGSAKVILWKFDNESGEIIDSKTDEVIGKIGGCPTRRNAELTQNHSLSFITTAHAATLMPIDDLLEDLESESVVTRRTSRTQLTQYGLDGLSALISAFAADKASYRAQLGTLVALVGFLRDNKDLRAEVINFIDERQLDKLVEAARHSDRTMRIYATEFLIDLDDPRGVALALKQIPLADETGRYNLLLIIQASIQRIASLPTRQAISADLNNMNWAGADKSQAIVEQIAKIVQTTAPLEYWIIVGSYIDQKNAYAYANRLNNETPSLNAFVGIKTRESPFYLIAVDNGATSTDARARLQRLLSAGVIAKDAYVKYAPDLKP